MRNDEYPFYDTSISNKSMFRNSISLLNINSIKDFENKIDKKIEKSIFRGNLYFDGMEAWEERNWIGKTIKINDVLFPYYSTKKYFMLGPFGTNLKRVGRHWGPLGVFPTPL